MAHQATGAVALAALLSAGTVQAATIIEETTGRGTPIALDVADFVGSGPCGYGGSVINDGCSVVLKSDPDAPDAYGRFDPLGSSWIDSQDLPEVEWTVSPGETFQSLTFALTDAFDQNPDELLGESFFKLTVDGAEWSIAQQETNGTLHWITMNFDQPVTSTMVGFSTRLNDGWGIKAALVSPDVVPAPVPLPAAGWLMLCSMCALIALRKRSTAA